MTGNRVAFVTASDQGLVCGDPTGDHILLTPTGLSYRRRPGTDGETADVDWADIRTLEVDAATSSTRRPALPAVLAGAAAEWIGLSWLPGIAAVTLLVEDEYGRVELACDGHIGRGYWTRHLRVVQEALDLFVTVPVTRAVLADPERALTNLGGAASGTSEQARTALLAAWAHPREH